MGAAQSVRAFGPAPGAVQPRVVTFDAEEMCTLWSHAETNGNLTYEPYFAVVVAPWTVVVSFSQDAASLYTTVSAVVTYTCPPGVDCDAAPVADRAVANVTLPSTLKLAPASNPLSVALGTLAPSASVEVQWQVLGADIVTDALPPTVITVVAAGLVSASVPEYAGYYPAYNYSDWIGGSGSVGY